MIMELILCVVFIIVIIILACAMKIYDGTSGY